jgi:hypothetical protein
MKMSAGTTTRSGATMPKIAHVLRHPTSTNRDAAHKGIVNLATPVPKLAMPMARPRLRTNHCAIVTFMTREPSRASPAITNEQRTMTNCQKFCTRAESSNPVPSMRTPRTRTPRPPWRSIHGPRSGTISAATPISNVRISEKAPRETPSSSVIGFRKMLNVLEKANVPAMLTRIPTPTMYQP